VGGFTDRLVLDRLHHADDLSRYVVGTELKMASDRIALWPVSTRHGLVDDRDRRSPFPIAVGEVATANEGDTGRGEVQDVDRVHDQKRRARLISRFRFVDEYTTIRA